MRSNMLQHSFARVQKANVPRSRFKMDSSLKTTFDGGYFVPIFWLRIVPGDTIQCSIAAMIRMSTPIVPVMDNIKCDFYFFYEPDRLLQTNFPKLMGEQVDPGDSIAYLLPTIAITNAAVHSLPDYLGLPTEKTNAYSVVSSRFRMYNDVWNNFIRDQNLQDSVTVDRDDGPDNIADYVMLKAGKYRDYFTSALPWPQKGDAVTLPLGTVAPVLGIGKYDQVFSTGPQAVYETGGSGTTNYADYQAIDAGVSNQTFYVEEDPNNAGYPGIYADLTNATAATINELRYAMMVQRLLEADARGGTRYIEKIYTIYGVISPDLRPTRPVYLGGGSLMINMNPVAKTDFTAGTDGANLSAFSSGYESGIGFTASFTEHGHVMGFCVARADLTYQQGIERDFLDSTQYDHLIPMFAHLGEQVVYNCELWYTDEVGGVGSTTNAGTFGYQERYSHYRYKPSKITGLFKSDATGSLDIWTCAQDFASLPTLGTTFITEDPPFDRNIATPTEPHFIYDSFISLYSTRPLPLFGTPGLSMRL